MFKGQIAELHARLATEVAVWPATDQVVGSFLVQRGIGIETEIAIHPSKAALARHEAANDGPGHRRGFRKDFRKVVAAPHRALGIGTGRQGCDLFTADLLALGGTGRGDRPCLQKPELSFGPGPLHVARVAIKRFHTPAECGQFR